MTAEASPEVSFLAGGGDMGALMRAHDWASTPLGRPDAWPQSLRTTVSTCLNCAFPILVWWGPDLVKIYNDAYTQILGSKHPHALGRPGRDVWPEIWDVIGPMLDTVLTRGEPTRAEDLLLPLERHGYAEECYFSFSYSPIHDESGAVGGVFCPVIETTDRVIGERRLRLLGDLAQSAAGPASPEDFARAAMTCMANGGLRDFVFAALYLQDNTEPLRPIGTAGIPEGTNPALFDGAAWQVDDVIATGTSRILNNLRTRFAALADGAWALFPERALILPLDAGTGRRLGALVVGLSFHRPLEELRDFAELAAGQIASGLAKARAYEEERRRAEALAELDRAKTVFFSNVSHEFRTPLTLMLGPIEEILAKPEADLAADIRETLDRAHRSTLRLQKLVDSMLDFSRIEAGRMDAAYVPTDIAQMTAELASSYESLTERAGLRLTIACEPLPSPVYLDRDMWEKVVFNLLSNAFKFTLAGEIRVMTGLSADGCAAEVTVADTGIGIPAEALPRLFERFYRVEETRGRSIEGSGIGLAMVRELVQLHGGTIRVASVPGEGSSFVVSIPLGSDHLATARLGADQLGPVQVGPAYRPAGHLAAAHPPRHTPGHPPEHPPEHPPGSRVVEDTRTSRSGRRSAMFLSEAERWLPLEPVTNSEQADAAPASRHPGFQAASSRSVNAGHVLVADDNADMRGYIERLLANAGFSVQAVADGQSALDAALRRAPDLVLTDVMMPRLDGFALLSALRGDPRTAHLPVVLLSARAGDDARIEGLQAGADDYLVKPFNARELVARVEGNIRLARQRWRADRKVLAQKGILERIATAAPLDEILQEIVRFVEQELPGAQCAIMTLSDDGTRIASVRAAGLAAAYCQTLTGSPLTASVVGPCGLAARTGRAVAVGNTGAETGFPDEWRHLMRRHGIRAILSTPVLAGRGAVVGLLELLFLEPADPLTASPVAADPELTDIATKLIAIAIERHSADATLREREERLRLIIDSAREYAIITTDPQGRITSWNAGAERLLGYAAEEVLGQPTDIFFTPEDRASRVPQRELEQALQQGRAGNERWHIRKDGTRFFASGVTLPLADGPERGLLAIFRDRTQERQLEEEVQRRNAELRAVLEAVPVAVWFTHDDQAQYADGNRVAAELLRLAPGANASETPAGGMRPAHRSFRGGAEADPRDLPLQRAVRGESVWNDLVQVRMADGRMRDLICSAVPLFDPSGRVIGAVCTGTDVTEQIATERKLRELTETLEQRVVEAIAERNILADVVEGTDALIQVIDMDYRWLAINRACADEIERTFGLRPRVGESMLDLFAGRPSSLAALRALWDRALSGDEFTEIVELGDLGAGARFYEAKFNALRDPDGAQTGAYHFVHEVTERVESQVRLAEAQAQLHEMQKLETIGQLSGGIAHDFNNLLTPIVAGLDLLRARHQKDERSVRLISAAMQSAERARVLVGRLLSFARRQNLEARPVSIPDLVSGMRDLIARSLGPQIAITLDLPDQSLTAEVDPNQLELALLNLCVNARDAMPDGGKLLITSHRAEVAGGTVASLAPGSYIRLSVTDTGSGMDKETLRRAVEPFYTTKDVGRGTGLGLSTVHGLALQSGGALVLDSTPGIGTTATIYLPVTTAPAAAESPAEVAASGPVSPLSILLVDDEELVRTGVSDILEDLGHHVVTAASAAAALDYLRRLPGIDLLITDYMMPSMTGLALIQEARQLRPDIPALLLTGYASVDGNGAHDVPRLAKPLRESELSAAIWAALNARREAAGTQASAGLSK